MFERIFINADISTVYSVFWNIFEWDRIIPHVEGIIDIDSTENYQHVYMKIKSHKKSYTIETERTGKIDECINFKQLNSNSIITEHSGSWLFYKSGEGTIVESLHKLKVGDIGIISKLISKFVWKNYVRKNAVSTLETLKLESEFIVGNFSLVSDNSRYLRHEFNLKIPVEKCYKIISNPIIWTELYGNTAKMVKVRRESEQMVDFYLVELVGKWKLSSRIFMRKDGEKLSVYYQHISPRFPIKSMIIHWDFLKLDDDHSKFIIHREFQLRIPRFIYQILQKKIEKIIEEHVLDYQTELNDFIKLQED